MRKFHGEMIQGAIQPEISGVGELAMMIQELLYVGFICSLGAIP